MAIATDLKQQIPYLRDDLATEVDTTKLSWAGSYCEPTEEELVQRATEVAQLLIPLQEATEQRTHYSREVHQLFKDAGFYQTLVPKKYGGLEFSFETFMRVVIELCSGCSNTGWQFALGSAHALQLGTEMPENIQDEIFADPNFVVPGTVAPSGEGELAPNGDLKLSGVWRYASGVPYGSHFTANVRLADGSAISFLATRDKYEILNDWGRTTGMKGSGSHSIRFDEAVIPATHVNRSAQLSAPHTEGWRQHGNKMYTASHISVSLLTIMAVGVGIAKNAKLAFDDEVMSKNTTFGPIGPRTEDRFYQDWYGEGVGKLDAAETLMLAIGRRWLTNLERGIISHAEDMRLIGMAREVMHLFWEAVSETFVRKAGSSQMMNGTRMERAWRDMSTFYSHNGVVFFAEFAKGEFTRSTLGVGQG